MKNIHYVSLNEFRGIQKALDKNNSFYIAEIDGKEIYTLSDYLAKMSNLFQFPYLSLSIDGYNDWMRDLDWLEKDGYILVIYNFHFFLKEDLSSRKQVIDNFYDIILPFWEYEVTETVVEGKVKPFIIYFVE